MEKDYTLKVWKEKTSHPHPHQSSQPASGIRGAYGTASDHRYPAAWKLHRSSR